MLRDSLKKEFDLDEVFRGCVMRVKKKGEKSFRMGFVSQVSPQKLRLTYPQLQNQAIGHLELTANEVDSGIYEILFSRDLEEVLCLHGQESGLEDDLGC